MQNPMNDRPPERVVAALRLRHQIRRAPEYVRAYVRASELALIGLAALIGLVGGALVAAIGWLAQTAHEHFFGIAAGARLSGVPALPTQWSLLLPAVGGIVLGASLLLVGVKRRPPVDPIEANALHGGRLSIGDSVLVVVQNLISNGFGASVGLEAEIGRAHV